MKPEETVVGTGVGTGIFITKEEFSEIVKAIYQQKPIETTVNRNPATQSYDVIQKKDKSPEELTADLAKAYKLPEARYGINKFREFILFIEK